MGYENPNDYESSRGDYSLPEWERIKSLRILNSTEFEELLEMDFILIKLKNGVLFSKKEAQKVMEGKDQSEIIALLNSFADTFGKDNVIRILGYNYDPFRLDKYREAVLRDRKFNRIFMRLMNFSDVDSFNAAKQGGFRDRVEFLPAQKAGCISKKEWLEFKETGYETLQDLENAKEGGFSIPTVFYEAKSDGFSNFEEWEKFKDSGFETKQEYLQAKDVGITDVDTLDVYNFLSELDIGEQIALSKIAKETYIDPEDLEEIMEDSIIQQLGSYNENIEIFTRQKSSSNKPILSTNASDFAYEHAVIDGNNVAYGDNDIGPKLGNISAMYNILQETGLKPYVVISAALRHHIDDSETLGNFLSRNDWIEAPAGRSDDFFFIQIALQKDAFIVTKDRMRNWIDANPNLAQEIEDRRVGFTFVDGKPILDHKISKLIKQPIE